MDGSIDRQADRKQTETGSIKRQTCWCADRQVGIYESGHCRTGSMLAHTNLSPFARCTLGLTRHFY